MSAHSVKIDSFQDAGQPVQYVQHVLPVVIAGGEVNDHWDDFLKSAKTILAAGVAGLCVGRRIFTQADPARATAALRAVVHGGSSLPSDDLH